MENYIFLDVWVTAVPVLASLAYRTKYWLAPLHQSSKNLQAKFKQNFQLLKKEIHFQFDFSYISLFKIINYQWKIR